MIKEIECYSGKWDCSESEIEFIKDYLRNIEFNDYDKLIQFCDAIIGKSIYTILPGIIENTFDL